MVSANLRMFASVAGGNLKSCAYALGLRPMYYEWLAPKSICIFRDIGPLTDKPSLSKATMSL